MTNHDKKDKSQKMDVKKAPEKAKKSVSKTCHQHGKYPVFMTVLAISSLSALALSLYSINYLNSTLQQVQNKTDANITSNLGHIETMVKQHQLSTTDQINALKQEQKDKFSTFSQALMNLDTKNKGNSQSWKLERAAYLLNMAQLSLHWEKSPLPAIRLLESSDELIQALKNPLYLGLRQTLSNEISELKSLPSIDTAGLLAQLDSLSLALNGLPLKAVTPEASETSVSNSVNPTKNHSRWQQALDKSLESLSKIVVIRKHDVNYHPLLSQDEKKLITQQLQLSLKQAQWALIHQEQKIYTLVLTQINQTLTNYFDINDESTQHVLKQLHSLSKQDISPKLPSINRSYQQLMELIHTQKNSVDSGVKA